ncbi:MAG: hypothetical protein GX444_04995 [Myxococcales bacterium]|nr:hypothetical protein [Myxococcales bacterium]
MKARWNYPRLLFWTVGLALLFFDLGCDGDSAPDQDETSSVGDEATAPADPGSNPGQAQTGDDDDRDRDAKGDHGEYGNDDGPSFDDGEPDPPPPAHLWAVCGTRDLRHQSAETGGFFLHYQNETWEVVEPPVTMGSLQYLSVETPRHGLAADGQTLLRFDGQAWTVDEEYGETVTGVTIFGVLATADADWVFGYGADYFPVVYRYRDGLWQESDTSQLPSGYLTRPVDAAGTIRAVLINMDNWPVTSVIVRYDESAGQWVTELALPSIWITQLAFAGADWGLAAGTLVFPPISYNLPLIYQGGTWHFAARFPAAISSSPALSAVATNRPGSGFVFGYEAMKVWIYYSVIYNLDGRSWREDGGFWNRVIVSAQMGADGVVWAAGYNLTQNSVPLRGMVAYRVHGRWNQADLPTVTRPNWGVWDLAILSGK